MKNGKTFALFLIAAAFLLLLTACGGAGQTVVETSPPTGGTLMECTNTDTVFGSPTLERSQIRSITFLSGTANTPADSWDISQEQNGSVIAWTVENGELFDLFIASDGGVIAPENCERMFSGYRNVESIAFNSAFDTSNVTNMFHMFSGCKSLTALDVSNFDTSHVTDMSHMFAECESLTALDISGFDTSHVTNMSYMFISCKNLNTLDLSGFDTSNVEIVETMFYECPGVTEEDVSKLDLSNATDANVIFSIGSPLGFYVSDGRLYNAGESSETSGE